MELKKLKLTEIKPYGKNPRKNDGAVDAVAESIKQCGYCSPIVVDENYEVLAGHTRLKDLEKVRIINIIGAALFVIYGILIHAVSTWLLNGILIAIHLFYLIKDKKGEK